MPIRINICSYIFLKINQELIKIANLLFLMLNKTLKETFGETKARIFTLTAYTYI